MKQDSWIEEKLATTQKQHQDVDKVIKLEQTKTLQAKTKITKVREGFEGGLYGLDDAKSKVNGYLETVKKAEQEIKRLEGMKGDHGPGVKVDELKKELEKLAQKNLEEATFADKRDIISKFGIKVYPSEDLKTMKVKCTLNFENDDKSQASNWCGIIQFASAIQGINRLDTDPVSLYGACFRRYGILWLNIYFRSNTYSAVTWAFFRG